MTKLAVFDFDSTLMDGETINFLAKAVGIEKKVASITERAMAGELDFFNSLTQRVALLKGIELDRVNIICQNLPMMPGAKEVVAGLKKRGFVAICFSGGFRNATKHACDSLGIDADFANFLHHKHGILTGQVGGEMMETNSKGDMMQRIQQLLDIPPSRTVAIGDGANDISMFKHADTKIAFCAHEILNNASTHTVKQKDLQEILPIVDAIY
jgi:phosphoserine phosphatase